MELKAQISQITSDSEEQVTTLTAQIAQIRNISKEQEDRTEPCDVEIQYENQSR